MSFMSILTATGRTPTTSAAIVGLLSRAAFVKLLGSYPPAQPLEPTGVNGQASADLPLI